MVRRGGDKLSMSCRTCKYFYMSECKCKEFKGSVNAQNTNNGYSYTEEGLLYENLKESDIMKYIIRSIWTDLAEKDIIKKNRKIKNYDYEDIEADILQEIDEKLSPGINRYFDGVINDLSINDPDNFYCCYWE